MNDGPYQALQTVAMGLVIVFVDAGRGGWDWVADPLGWILVLAGLAPLRDRLPSRDGLLWLGAACLALSVFVFPPTSVANVEESLGWAFSLPTLVFCFVLCDALADVLTGSLATVFTTLRTLFLVVAVLPVLVFGASWGGLTIPTAVLAVGVNVALVLALWQASSAERQPDQPSGRRDEQPRGEREQRRERGHAKAADDARHGEDKPRSGASRAQDATGRLPRQVTGEEVLEKVRRRRRARRQDSDL